MGSKTLEELRATSGLSVKDAAAAIGVSFNTLRCWERGKLKPRMSRIDTIADTYGVSRDDVLMAIGINPAEAHRLKGTQRQRISTGNRKAQSNSKTSVLGVSRIPSGRYVARIRYQGKLYYLGTFETMRDAETARKFAEKLLFDMAMNAYID